MSETFAEKLIASAIHYLIQGKEFEAATLLLACECEVQTESAYGSDIKNTICLRGPRSAYDALCHTEYDNRIYWQVEAALRAVTDYFAGFSVQAQMIDTLDSNWRAELLEIVRGRGTYNQGVTIPGREIVTWRNLHFRSQSEVRIALALDASRVLYLPNCLARLGLGDNRQTREADFLICSNGKWGILEVDGPFHTRAAEDHERDRLFHQHGIFYIQRFKADECYANAVGVVKQFLELLAQTR